LEPCAHQGRGAPCARAIVEAGIARVVSAMQDPDPRTAGEGHALLRQAGIEVVVGVGSQEARRAHLGHILRLTHRRPAVTLKLAQTADGFAAGARNDPRLAITGEAANARVQILRAMHDAIMIGIGTALGDDPLLTARFPSAEARPLRVVLDPFLRLSPRSRLGATAGRYPTLVIAGRGAPADQAAALAATGVEIAETETDAAGRLDLAAALRLLAERGITRVFSEGGPTVGSALIAGGFADVALIFTAPKPLGRQGMPALDQTARSKLDDRSLYRLAATAHFGVDDLRSYERIF
jgi:diaminohydroxyphosphoribosylaminopyrimidine deaminase/5-amino-6-(5-phosphoribosylamino)uracil reductase